MESWKHKIVELWKQFARLRSLDALELSQVPEEELDERSVGRILSSFTFLSLHHTFNQELLRGYEAWAGPLVREAAEKQRAIIGPKRSDAERGEVAQTASGEGPAAGCGPQL
eukprot:Skav233836  [mRNA]  locus=scaffold2623:175038:177330:+ [translate_table: standard]